MDINNFKPNYEIGNVDFESDFERNYINKGGIYRGKITKVYKAEIMSQQGNKNTNIFFEFESNNGEFGRFDLFVAKNGNTSYFDSKGDSKEYLGFRFLNAIMILLGVNDLYENSKAGKECIYGKEQGVNYLNSLCNKEICLAFNTEEAKGKKGTTFNKLNLSRVYNSKGQSLKEFKENIPANEYKSFKSYHKPLEYINTKEPKKDSETAKAESIKKFINNDELPF